MTSLRLPRLLTDSTMFAGAVGAGLLHGLDDAFVHRGAGVGAHATAGLLATGLAVAAVAAFPRSRPGVRAALALGYGTVALSNGILHAIHANLSGASGGDFTGVAAAVAGVVLVVLGASIPWRHRAERPATRGRRWRNRAIGTAGGVLAAWLIVMPVAFAITTTHKYREEIGRPPSAAYRTVEFDASDGVRLAGWYHPSRNGAAVVLVHGGGGDRSGPRDHARMLARHGYGVLLYDARGRGESEGSHNAYGWNWDRDVAGAMRFLRAQPDVRGEIGGLGLSTGADVLMEVAAGDRSLKAVVADGATARSFMDVPKSQRVPFASFWMQYAAAHVLMGADAGPPLRELVARIAPTPLLLVSAAGPEHDLNRDYAEAAGEPVELWELPDVRHTNAVRERPAEYEHRVVGLFDRALLGEVSRARP